MTLELSEIEIDELISAVTTYYFENPQFNNDILWEILGKLEKLR